MRLLMLNKLVWWSISGECVGERRVIAIVQIDSVDTLDQILFTLPIMQKMGQHVQIKVTALRRYEDFAADLKTWIEK